MSASNDKVVERALAECLVRMAYCDSHVTDRSVLPVDRRCWAARRAGIAEACAILQRAADDIAISGLTNQPRSDEGEQDA
jgi:hypothetical protein